MKRFFNYRIALLAVFCLTIASASAQNGDAKAWVQKGEWRNGLKVKLFPGLNNAEFARQYKANKAWWDKAFAYMSNTNLDSIAPGKYPIDGDNVFATVTEGTTKEYEKTGWEAHHKYLDLHLMIRGKERIGVMDPATAKVTNPYDTTKDVENYDANTKGNYYVAEPGTLYIFFPHDSHRPGIHVEGFDTEKKLVIKIRVAE